MRVLLAFAATALLAGCVAEGGPAPDGPADDDPLLSPHHLALLVTDEPNGPPLPSAQVEVLWDYASGWGGRRGDGAIGTTGPDGRLTIDVPAGADVWVNAWRGGHTRETAPPLRAGEKNGTTSIEIPLFRETVVLALDGALSPADASGHRAGQGDFKWYPNKVAWASDASADAGYRRRLVQLDARLSWVNGAAGAGDLGFALGKGAAAPDLIQDSEQTQVEPREYVEERSIRFDEIYAFAWRQADGFHAGPGTGTAYAAPLGLAWHLELVATFDGDLTLDDRAPIPLHVPLVMLGLCAAALLLRKRGGSR